MNSQFGTIDWIIVIGYVAGATMVGWYCRRFIKDVADFLVAGRSLGPYLGIAALAGTELGLITVMYFAEEAYRYGYAAMIMGFISGGTMLFLGKTGFVVDKLRAMRVMTIPEYFERRYTKGVRILAASAIFVGGILNFGVFLKVEGIFLVKLLGLGDTWLIPLMATLLIIVLFYTLMGGMVSVVITDYIQFVILTVGIGITTILVLNDAGWGHMVDSVRTALGPEGFNPITAPHYGVTFIIWQLLLYVSVWSIWQPVAARVFSSKDQKTGRKVLAWNGYLFVGRAIIPMVWGIAAFAMLGMTDKPLEAMPSYIAGMLPSGIAGVVTAGMLAASMSTYAGYLLAWGAILSQDILAPLRRKALTESQNVWFTRFGVVLVGVFIFYWGLFYEFGDTVYRYLTLTGTLYLSGTMTGIVGGIYWKRATPQGAYLALILGMVFPFVSVFAPTVIDSSLSGFLSFILAILGLVVGSLLSPKTATGEGSQI
jgi:solute:Na+ symporter, SSS family